MRFLSRDSLQHLVEPSLGDIVSHYQSFVAALILLLALSNAGVLSDTLFRHLYTRAACVFLIAEDAPDGLGVPFFLTRDRQNVPCGQVLCDPVGCHTFKEKLEDEPHDLGLLLVDGEIAVLALVIAEKVRVADGELAVGKLFPESPCDVLRDGSCFLLRQAAEDGQEDFSIPIFSLLLFSRCAIMQPLG